MGSIRVDDSRWPIVIHTVEGRVTDEQVDAYILEAERILSRRKSHVTILDATRIGTVSAYTRSRSTQWQNAHRAELAAHCLETIYVISSPLVRFIAMTVLLVTNLPTPYRICHNLDEALAHAIERLQQAASLGS